ncbi:unnamed protein product [Miscanthus lutarioriparius]|uniref:Uncharacterized protein n=1 Tax=Miscanthus lutarioriparius TaxID=422564 RepID=A0A811QAF5_9POAL|nr:unnamed protein product [Miscanthus lutarioriparius]
MAATLFPLLHDRLLLPATHLRDAAAAAVPSSSDPHLPAPAATPASSAACPATDCLALPTNNWPMGAAVPPQCLHARGPHEAEAPHRPTASRA